MQEKLLGFTNWNSCSFIGDEIATGWGFTFVSSSCVCCFVFEALSHFPLSKEDSKAYSLDEASSLHRARGSLVKIAFVQTCLLWLRSGRTKAFPLPVLPRGLLDERTTPELLSAQVGLLARAVPASPTALPRHTAGEVSLHRLPGSCCQVPAQPCLAKELTCEKPLPSLTWSRSRKIAGFWGI